MFIPIKCQKFLALFTVVLLSYVVVLFKFTIICALCALLTCVVVNATNMITSQ